MKSRLTTLMRIEQVLSSVFDIALTVLPFSPIPFHLIFIKQHYFRYQS